jgi:hypothetical protein
VRRLPTLVILALIVQRAIGTPELAAYVLLLRARQARGAPLTTAEQVVVALAEQHDVRIAA